MRNFQDTFETRKRSFISGFSICINVPLDKGSSRIWNEVEFLYLQVSESMFLQKLIKINEIPLFCKDDLLNVPNFDF